MALQKFAHGATHYCKFKHTALCENALHYDNKITINKQILCTFQKKNFSKIKKIKHTFLSSNVLRLVRQTFELKHSRFQPFYLQRTRKLYRVSHSCASSSFKEAAPKVLWEKVISRRSKELKSDPDSCPLVWAPC